MRQVHCDGCGATEDLDIASSTIKPVKIFIFDDLRPGTEQNGDKYEAELCPTCRGSLVEGYFGVKPEFELEVPDFLRSQVGSGMSEPVSPPATQSMRVAREED